jgi:hypothetical protein
MPAYDKEIYSQKFARLLNRAMKKGGGDPQKALQWLDKQYKPIFALIFTRHKLETSDAYMDVREHIVNRIKGNESEEDETKN